MRRALLTSLLLCSAAQVHAQAADEQADQTPIIVTGRGLSEGLGEDVFDVASVSRERLSSSASNRLEDVLGDVPGFQSFRRSDARSANPTSQGATLRALGGNASSRALLTLDGVPQTDPFGGWVYWPAYDPRRLGAVRVVRGGGTGVYGPGALAGTIELFSAGPGDLDGVRADLAYGSRDSVDTFAAVGGKLGSGYGSVSAGYARGDGFIPTIESQRGAVDRPSPYEQASIALRGVAPIGRDVELQASGLWFSDNRERGTAFSGNRTNGLDGSLRLVGEGDWRWSALVYVQHRQYYNSFASVSADRNSVTRASEQFNVPSDGRGARIEVRPPIGEHLELRVGSDWRGTSGNTNEYYNYVAGAPTRVRRAGGESDTIGVFAEAAWKNGPLTVTAGGRVDRWSIRDGILHERQIATGAVLTDANYPDRKGWEPTARGGVAWQPIASITVRTAAYIGWRLPTLNELYRPFRVGPDATAANPALKPERLKGIEAGADYRPLSNAHLGFTVFDNRLEDAIGNVTLGTGPGTFPGVGFVAAGATYSQRQNLDRIHVRGIELDAGLEFGPWSVDGGYSHVAARVRSDGPAAALDGRRPAQTPRDSLAGTLSWHRAEGFSASVTGRYIGNQFEDDLGTQRIPSAVTFDASAVVPVTRSLSIQARAENIGNERVVAGISGSGIVERATPRTFWIGLRLRG